MDTLIQMIIDINKKMKWKIVIINDDTILWFSYIYMNKDIIYQKFSKINKKTLQDFMSYVYMKYEWDWWEMKLDDVAPIMWMWLKNVHRLEKAWLKKLMDIKKDIANATDTIEK